MALRFRSNSTRPNDGGPARWGILVAAMVGLGSLHAEPPPEARLPQADERLSPETFADPPIETRPGCFWSWLNGAMTPEQITRDLEAMKRTGMRGGEIWDVAAHADPDDQVPSGPPFLGPESTRLIVHAIREADRLGMRIGLLASSGWNAGGSWIPPEHAGKGLYHSATRVTGPRRFEGTLPLPELPVNCPRDEDGLPLYLGEVAVLAVPGADSGTLEGIDQVVDLTAAVVADGNLGWEVPAGEWTILRFVCTNHGQQLIVPSPESGGVMIDFFAPAATEFHLQHIVSTILSELGRPTFEGTSFRTMEFDSMELDGFTPWTGTMAAAFERHVGYSPIRHLPLLAGWKLADGDEHGRFRYDWKKFLSDRLIESHYATARRLLAGYGVELIAEAGGPGPPIWPSNPVDGVKALGAVDIPRGEFWMRHRGIFLIKEIASAAHVYGKRVVDAEAFTTWRRWVDGPLNHKKIADRALCEGLNHFSLHTFTSSPPEAGRPGWAYHAGTDINPTATWWPMARGLMDYLARCSHLLRQGSFVADVCYFYGDQAPNFFPPECFVPERLLLDGLHPGHDFDVCSSEVILERMAVEGGRITLPDGMSYAALVLPEQDHMPVAVLAKVHDLVRSGATVIARQRPIRAPGLRDPDEAAATIARMVAELWGDDGPAEPGDLVIRHVGDGRFIVTTDRSRALREIGVGRDFQVVGLDDGTLGPLDFIHRRTAAAECYFVRNQSGDPQSLKCRFRVAAKARGLRPEFWWPHSGHRSGAAEWSPSGDGHTEVTVDLPPFGSVFVVFRKGDGPLDSQVPETMSPAEAPAPRVLDGPWQVSFPEGWGAPEEATFPELRSWTESDHPGIRYFSGIATYRRTFELSPELAAKPQLILELGDLAEIAEVTLNGKPLGLVWLPPHRVGISTAARAGINRLEVRVANLWANRLNGDSLLPVSERFTRSNLDRMQFDPTSDSSFRDLPQRGPRPVHTDHPPLMKSGLLGPVRIFAPSPVR